MQGPPAHEIGITATRPLVDPLGQSVLAGRIAPFTSVMHPRTETCAVHPASACSRNLSSVEGALERQPYSPGGVRAQLPHLMLSGVMRSCASSLELGRMIALPLILATWTSRDSMENTARRRPRCWDEDVPVAAEPGIVRSLMTVCCD